MKEALVDWVKYPNSVDNHFYKFARVGDVFINQGDNVRLPPEEEDEPPQIAQVAYMFETPDKSKMFHAHFYCRGLDTILGDKSDPKELFLVDHCEDVPLKYILDKTKVNQIRYQSNWYQSGGLDMININESDDGTSYYFSKRYDYNNSRFVDFRDNRQVKCMSCFWQKEEEKFNESISIQFYADSIGQSYVKWRNVKYFVGCGVFIDYERETVHKIKKGEIKEGKTEQAIEAPCEPFTVGVIEKILKNNSIKIREFYRVEDTSDGKYGNPHLVFWTNNLYTISNLEKWTKVIKGKCYVMNKENIPNVHQWIREGPFRFFYEKSYNPQKKTFGKLPPTIQRCLTSHSSTRSSTFNSEIAPLWPEIKTKLKCLDIYAGCGGLSDGLERAGLVETKWAIENDEDACRSFKMNHQGTLVLQEDCNDILYKLLNKEGNGLNMPKNGEIDMIVGGPPCQGYSIINRFKSAQSTKENNSQINTYLGFIDYYRPKYFIFENVRNFVSFEQSSNFKLTLRCLLEIGYQITFGVLQAGHYGLPQSRRRIFIAGAAPGLILPPLPAPTHCFGSFEKRVESVVVDKLKYDNGDEAFGVFGSLPYRRVTVRDAIADLPVVDYDSMKPEMAYTSNEADVSFYAKCSREYCDKSDVVMDHECTQTSTSIRKKMTLVPPGGDLNNIQVPEEDVTEDLTEDRHTLYYCLETTRSCVKKTFQSKIKKVSKSKTIKKGTYGRVSWDGTLATVTTNPEPTATQGRVLHPEQHRVLTVRECARAQGFHDEFQFAGSVRSKYKQIGNAVPPILATAIGREFVKVLSRKT
ncbi:DNA (cytosine-5)-methyltransferase 1-like [Euwallacea similis]|uniref:DNA (cytosine-5)-methyltransferase 1-like n=1 Tax=Euwallacea similis TaxID=1736056 RepID=UPI00344BF329